MAFQDTRVRGHDGLDKVDGFFDRRAVGEGDGKILACVVVGERPIHHRALEEGAIWDEDFHPVATAELAAAATPSWTVTSSR